eukprot:CAMPEP_0196656814 /NCGR_PEP_ID=MMETSP1086-20130531/19676_1 /TAXON_ID=77921 /ORGANISM="Cyanoptyche  gloeocystis , Strain SAG4.97" /LENGTH=230 /DNA_ID=CAMNT_0041989691 /DNA_START=41 /DNA_END=733 /DNA_ORIENTATION=+
MSGSNENLSPAAINRLCKELKELAKTPPEGIQVIINEENIADIQADIEGPVGTPFEGGLFRVKLVLGQDFPQAPPKGFFITKIFHPNVSKSGDICVNTLKKDWRPDLNIQHILLVVRCLLIAPYPESALNEEAGKLLLEDYEEYAKRAKLFTGIHAKRPDSPSKSETRKDGKADNKDGDVATESSTSNKENSAKEGGQTTPRKRVPNEKLPKQEKVDQKALDRKRSMKRL